MHVTRRVVGAAAAMVLFASAALAGDQKRPVQTVSSVDLSRYAGTWYEIARYPNRFQKQCTGNVTATYELRDDGNVTVVNSCKTEDGETDTATGKAKIVDSRTNARLKVSFFGPFYGDYWIINLGPNYEYAVVGTPDRDYLWILSRTPQIDEALYDVLLQRIAAQGFDTARIVKTPQGI
jgi:apolipoprotein D and lipocalin family protein